jgi:hypothetical protein
VLLANPSKSGGDWWYGTLVKSGKKGLFPKTYVQEVFPRVATAVYTYNASDADEMSFEEGQSVTIIESADDEWWKAESDGSVLIVPAAYLEFSDGELSSSSPSPFLFIFVDDRLKHSLFLFHVDFYLLSNWIYLHQLHCLAFLRHFDGRPTHNESCFNSVC